MRKEKKILITTPIYYVNDKPHIGHAYTTLTADVLTRFFRKQGKEVFFLTGTDEHGIKIANSAKKIGKSPEELCNENSELFKKTWRNLKIQYDYFIRTTDKRHKEAVIKFVEKLKQGKAIYEKEYEGLYCRDCEKFITKKELIDGKCSLHKIRPEKVSEKNYFFKLKNYIKDIKKLIEAKKLIIIPENSKKEALGLLKQGLDDFSISRQKEKVKWGISLPFDSSQTIYVWVDALLNYITAVGYGDDINEFKKWWRRAHVIHLLGKDILKFHTIFWPALLLAVKEKTPNEELIHGFFTVNGQKMSKSLGNVIDPNNLVKKFGVDATRYLLLSQFSFGRDGDIQENIFIEKYNSDLANGLGNLVARVLTLISKAPYKNENYVVSQEIKSVVKKIREDYKQKMEKIKIYEALRKVWELITFCDGYLEKTRPWELLSKDERKKTDSDNKVEKVINNLFYCVSEVANLISPFLPTTSEKIKNQLKERRSEVLFPRL